MLARLVGLGGSLGLVALLLWPFHAAREALFWPFVGAAAVAGLSGAAILLVTASDILFHRRRGAEIRPVRGFDIVLGALLVGLSALQLGDAAGRLPA